MLFSLWAILFIIAGCSTKTDIASDEKEEKNQKLVIYTSFYPLYDFTAKIAGERAETINLIPAGVEPHEFEPTSKEVIKMMEADIFIYNGAGFEGWVNNIVETLDKEDTTVLNASKHVRLLTAKETGNVGEDTGQVEQDKNQKEGKNIYDPHIWLDPISMKDVAAAIKETLIQKDPAGKKVYEDNYNAVIEKLNSLDKQYKEITKDPKRRDVIVSHAAFGYLLNRYDLNQVPISGLSPIDEPTQKELENIITFAEQNNVRYILFETLVSGKVAEVVRNQIGAEALYLNPLEGLTEKEIKEGKDYFSVMKENLQSIDKAVND
jgi:zinc transport system substrate-binding protein